MAIFTEITDAFLSGYESLTGFLPPEHQSLINVFIFSLLISLYSIFTWKFYRFLSKKDLISLNLSQYNHATNPSLKKISATLLYLIEYIIVLPFIIFFWFAVLALIILVLSEEQTAPQIITISAAIVTSIRMLSYYQEDLSRDLAKMFPFTILAIFALNPSFFSLPRIFERLTEISSFTINIFYFLVFIVTIELLLRIIDVFFNFFDDGETDKNQE